MSSPLAMARKYSYASSCASTSSSESHSPSSTSSRAANSPPHASAKHGLDIFFPAAPASDFSSSALAFPSWPRSDTLLSPPASSSRSSSSSSSSPSSLSSSTMSPSSSSSSRVSSYISDEDLFGLDDLAAGLPYLIEAPAPPRQAEEWQQQFLQPQMMVLAAPSHQPLPLLVARPRTKRTASAKKPLHRSKTSRALPVIKESSM